MIFLSSSLQNALQGFWYSRLFDVPRVLGGRSCYHPQVCFWKARSVAGTYRALYFTGCSIQSHQTEDEREAQVHVQCYPGPKCEAKGETQGEDSPLSFSDSPKLHSVAPEKGAVCRADRAGWEHRGHREEQHLEAAWTSSRDKGMIGRKARKTLRSLEDSPLELSQWRKQNIVWTEVIKNKQDNRVMMKIRTSASYTGIYQSR